MKTQTRPKFEQEFKDLPLEQKISSLFRMEFATLEETFTYVVDSTKKAAEKAGEAFSDFSTKVECEFKKATSSRNAKTSEAKSGDYTPPKAKPKGGAKKPSSRGRKT